MKNAFFGIQTDPLFHKTWESLKTDINLEKKKKNWEMQSENCKTKSTVR